MRRLIAGFVFAATVCIALAATSTTTEAAGRGQPADWQRFYYYPYIYYPHTFQAPTEFNHLYYRYPPARQIPVYNEAWHNFYPTERPYHKGKHFMLDVF